MTEIRSISSAARVFYRDVKPYDAPGRLKDLKGPAGGVLHLPITVYWGPAHIFDLANESDAVEAYQAIIREGRTIDQKTLLNRDLLVRVWPELLLPVRVRTLWETRFPELASS